MGIPSKRKLSEILESVLGPPSRDDPAEHKTPQHLSDFRIQQVGCCQGVPFSSVPQHLESRRLAQKKVHHDRRIDDNHSRPSRSARTAATESSDKVGTGRSMILRWMSSRVGRRATRISSLSKNSERVIPA